MQGLKKVFNMTLIFQYFQKYATRNLNREWKQGFFNILFLFILTYYSCYNMLFVLFLTPVPDPASMWKIDNVSTVLKA